MDDRSRGILIGTVIIVLGLLALLNNIGLLSWGSNIFWAGFFFILAVICLRIFYKDHSKWWGLILGAIGIFLAITLIFKAMQILPDDLIGSFLFWIIAAAFIVVYSLNHNKWWAIIPAGVCLVLGVIVSIDQFHLLDSDFIPFILFLGIGLTFGFLYGIRDEHNQLEWAKYPAVIIILFSIFLLSVNSSFFWGDLLLPLACIFVGGFLIYRALRGDNNDEKDESVIN